MQSRKTIGGHKNPFKYFESIEGRNVVFDFQVNKFVDLKTPTADITQTSTIQDENITAEQLKNLTEQGPSLLLEQLRFHDKFRDISLIRLFFSLWAFYPGFDVSRYSIIRTQPNDIEPSTILSQRGENLASVLHEILTRHAFRDERDNLLNFLHVAYPFFENISPETVPGMKGKVLLKWHESDLPKPIEVWELSDGILRFLCLGAVLCNPQPPPLVCIDEPELGFHPRLIPIIGDMIKSAAEKTQLIITTHCPELLNCFNLDDIAVMIRENGKSTWHRPSAKGELKTLLSEVEGENLGELHRSGQLEVI